MFHKAEHCPRKLYQNQFPVNLHPLQVICFINNVCLALLQYIVVESEYVELPTKVYTNQ